MSDEIFYNLQFQAEGQRDINVKGGFATVPPSSQHPRYAATQGHL
jgi:hypothetical protein